MTTALWLTAATILAPYWYMRLRYMRFRQYAHIPQLPNHLLWGHLKVFGELLQQGAPDRHPDSVFETMWASIRKPLVMLVDLRPVNAPMILVTNHVMAERISKPSQLFPFSTPKSSTWRHMIPLIGETSILAREGQDWKSVRTRYNPGFASQHLSSLLPLVVDKLDRFSTYLDKYAASNEEFSLETLLSNLTFDIIGAVVLEVNLDAQQLDPTKQGELIRHFRNLLKTYNDDNNNLPWWLAPRTAIKRKSLGRRIDTLIRAIVQDKYREMKEENSEEKEGISRPCSIVALSLRDTDTLTPQILAETSDQIRSFLFAGHDSNTSVLQWVFYELSRTPRALQAVRDELDAVLGSNSSDPRAACAILADEKGDQLLSKLHYLNAVLKETLRLHPPAATTRMTSAGSDFMVTSAGDDSDSSAPSQRYCLDDAIIYSCHHIIHRDRAVYGENADEWAPERWLSEDASHIPASAWRPFERGPRNCIGQELANLESRVIIAVVARHYDFVKTGLGAAVLDDTGRPVLDHKGQYLVEAELYNTRRMLSKPVDGTMMKVRLTSTL